MRRVTGAAALAVLALLGGCANAPVPGAAVATRSPVVPCSTTYLLLATVSHCGPGGFKLGVATE